jgi:hypothetical protein
MVMSAASAAPGTSDTTVVFRKSRRSIMVGCAGLYATPCQREGSGPPLKLKQIS